MSVLTPSWTSEYNDTLTSQTCHHRPSSITSQRKENVGVSLLFLLWRSSSRSAEESVPVCIHHQDQDKRKCLSFFSCFGEALKVKKKVCLFVCESVYLELKSTFQMSTPAIWHQQWDKRKCLLILSRLFYVSLPSLLWAVWDDWGWQKLLQSCPEICQSFLLLGIVILGRAGGICQIRNMSDDKTK